ncbi:MAG: M48 family metalloprotease [Cocleimonas sp.]
MKRTFFYISIFLFSFSVHADLNLELPDLNLPDLGNTPPSFITSSKKLPSGLRVLRRFRASGQLIEDPEINIWIRSLGNRLTAQAANSSTPYYFVVSRSNSINAFATSGGVIVINTGLILRAKSESELAAVIAHEIAHLTQRHIPRMLEKAKYNQLVSGAAMLAGIFASKQDSQAGQAIINTTMATMAHQQLSFGREAESEADRVGLRILARAGFNPKGMPAILQKLERIGDDSRNAEIREFLQNHPLTYKRVSDTNERANKLGAFRGKENISFVYMREKLRALTHSTLSTPDSTPSLLKIYSKSLQQQRRRNYPLAIKILGNKTSNVSEAILLSQLFNRQRQFTHTIKKLTPLLRVYPGDEAITIPLAQAYLALHQLDNAVQILNNVNISEQTSLELFEVRQEAARLRGLQFMGLRATAQRNLRVGDYKSARIQLQQALKYPTPNSNDLYEVQQLLTELKQKKYKKYKK